MSSVQCQRVESRKLEAGFARGEQDQERQKRLIDAVLSINLSSRMKTCYTHLALSLGDSRERIIVVECEIFDRIYESANSHEFVSIKLTLSTLGINILVVGPGLALSRLHDAQAQLLHAKSSSIPAGSSAGGHALCTIRQFPSLSDGRRFLTGESMTVRASRWGGRRRSGVAIDGGW